MTLQGGVLALCTELGTFMSPNPWHLGFILASALQTRPNISFHLKIFRITIQKFNFLFSPKVLFLASAPQVLRFTHFHAFHFACLVHQAVLNGNIVLGQHRCSFSISIPGGLVQGRVGLCQVMPTNNPPRNLFMLRDRGGWDPTPPGGEGQDRVP